MKKIVETHISEIIPGDTVIHNNVEMTVTKSNILKSEFMGTSIFGDSYHSGHKAVKKVIYLKN